MAGTLRSNPVFDQLFDGSVDVVRRGEHQRDEPPSEGGRWPVTIVCVPPGDVRKRLHLLMREALVHAGPGHFLTGREDSSHLTVRALEPYRHAAAPDDPVSAEWIAALERAARATAPLSVRLSGVTLTRGTVMAQVETVDDAPWEFSRRLRTELGPLAWFEEQGMERNIWYASLVHFAAPIRDPRGLVEWVARHRSIEPVEMRLASATLVRSRHTRVDHEQFMAMEQWHTAPFTRDRPGAPSQRPAEASAQAALRCGE